MGIGNEAKLNNQRKDDIKMTNGIRFSKLNTTICKDARPCVSTPIICSCKYNYAVCFKLNATE